MSVNLSEQYDKIYRYCYFKVKNACLAEDLTQETFLRYFAQTSYVHRGKELAYLYTIARNLCADFYRKPQKAGAEGDFFRTGHRQLTEKCSENPMEHVETALHLQMAVEKLSPKQQEVILLRYVNQLSVKEICKITGLSRSSEYRMEKEALGRLKKMLEEG